MTRADGEDARARRSASARRARTRETAEAEGRMRRRGRRATARRRPAHDWIKFTLAMAAAGVIASCARAQDVWSCCDKAEGSCRSVCEKMSLAEMASDGALREDRIHNIYKFCSPALIEFWICMNATIQEVMAGDGWWGRACCSAARGSECRRACATGRDVSSAAAVCRRSDELAFFDCVQRQRDAQECCSQTQSVECHDACRDTLWRALRDAGAVARARVFDFCENSPAVAQCVRNLTRVPAPTDPLKYVGCCQQSESEVCRAACSRVLRGGSGDARDVLEALVTGGCGAPLPHDAFWQCFLRKDSRVAQPAHPAAVDRLGLDAAKLHCCRKGASARCRRLCTGTYDRDWLDSRPAFEAECLASSAELELVGCLQEVEEPCAAGCEGLTYCTNFNSRPTELFRACSPAADLAAHLHLNWQRARGHVKLGELQLPVHNSSRCSPELWRAVACVLHVKPCVHQTHSSRMCREDCLRLVSECVRWDAARALAAPASAALTAQQICREIAHGSEEEPCVRLADYLTPPPAPDEAGAAGEGTWSPCAGAPCNATQVCVANRACARADACPHYLCTPGCPVGESSELVVPVGTLVRVPIGSATDGCVKICECGARGTLQHCRPLPCVPYEDCTLLDHTVPHGATYYLECNKCKCYAGELACSQRACMEEAAGGTALLTRLPCNCPSHYLPVCVGGRTLASVCLARCSGYGEQETVSGACAGLDACARAMCPAGHACVPRPTVCLSPLQAPCLQYQCVKPDKCADRPESVCDTNGATHAHVCALVASGRRLSYRGACLHHCKGEAEGAVCGADGATYSSACAAAAALVSVDYAGVCVAVGAISDEPRARCELERVICAPLARDGCRAFTAPGACCPRCGGALRILYSKKQVQRARYVLPMEEEAMSARAVVAALARQVGVAECDVRGHLTVEAELFVSVESAAERPSALQARACELEAERLATLINTESARFSTELPLSLLLLALPVHAPLSSAALISVSTLPPLLLLLLPLLLLVAR